MSGVFGFNNFFLATKYKLMQDLLNCVNSKISDSYFYARIRDDFGYF